MKTDRLLHIAMTGFVFTAAIAIFSDYKIIEIFVLVFGIMAGTLLLTEK